MLVQDIRYALRSFLRAPGFTLVALITLALGIGGTTAIFSIVDGDYLDLKQGATFLSAVAGYRSDITDLTGRGEPVRVTGMETTAAFFDIFDAPPLLGRTYHEATDTLGGGVAVIGESIWRQQFGRDPAVVGSVVRLNGKPMEIIGVVPERLRHPASSDVWTLAAGDVPTSPLGPTDGDPRAVSYFTAVARIAGNRTLAEARGQLRTVSDQINAANSPDSPDDQLNAQPLATSMVEDVRTALLVVLGAVGFVLLIACANVAGLLIARGAARHREFAVRTALGAGRGRLILQLLTESLVLAIAGGVAGLMVALGVAAGDGRISMLCPGSPRDARGSDDSPEERVAPGTTVLIPDC